eukprot:113785-Amphidinium_carterae.1
MDPNGGDFCLLCNALHKSDWAEYNAAKDQNSRGSPLCTRALFTKVLIIPTPRSAVPVACGSYPRV